MSSVTASIEIAVPRSEVWQVVMDPYRLGEWVTIHRDLAHAEEGAVREGYKMDQQIHLRGVNLEIHWHLLECLTNQHAVWEGRGPARSRARTEYTLHDAAGGGTRFDYRNEFRAPLGPIGAIASRALTGGIPQREAHGSLERLRALLEGNREH
jgi:uncharacterized protein YndB with AHSA1/START domain